MLPSCVVENVCRDAFSTTRQHKAATVEQTHRTRRQRKAVFIEQIQDNLLNMDGLVLPCGVVETVGRFVARGLIEGRSAPHHRAGGPPPVRVHVRRELRVEVVLRPIQGGGSLIPSSLLLLIVECRPGRRCNGCCCPRSLESQTPRGSCSGVYLKLCYVLWSGDTLCCARVGLRG